MEIIGKKFEFKTKSGMQGLVRTNIAYAMVDGAESALMEAMSDFKSEGYVLRQEPKMKLNQLAEAVSVLRNRCKAFARDAYLAKDEKETDMFCKDADFLVDFITLIVDRSGGDPALFESLYKQVEAMPSKMDLI